MDFSDFSNREENNKECHFFQGRRIHKNMKHQIKIPTSHLPGRGKDLDKHSSRL